jgi:hypothetical protein
VENRFGALLSRPSLTSSRRGGGSGGTGLGHWLRGLCSSIGWPSLLFPCHGTPSSEREIATKSDRRITFTLATGARAGTVPAQVTKPERRANDRERARYVSYARLPYFLHPPRPPSDLNLDYSSLYFLPHLLTSSGWPAEE